MYLRETVTAHFRDAATVSVKLSMVMGMIVSYIIGGLIENVLYGELRDFPIIVKRMLPCFEDGGSNRCWRRVGAECDCDCDARHAYVIR